MRPTSPPKPTVPQATNNEETSHEEVFVVSGTASLQTRILEMLQDSKRPMHPQHVADNLGVSEQDLTPLFEHLEVRGRIYRTKRGKYAPPERLNLVVGVLDGTQSGSAYLVPEKRFELASDIYIPAHKRDTAAHGDRVVVRQEGRKDKDTPKGRVLRVLERARNELVGSLKKGRHFGFVHPDNQRLAFEVYLPGAECRKAEEGHKVLVEIENWGDGHKNPEGRILEDLGAPDDPGVDVLAIQKSYGLDESFPPKVQKAAERLKLPGKTELKQRRDLRELSTFTIDPTDAKDFDDALSVELLQENLFRVGIHIADVSHYVKPGEALDKEAAERACSVYLVDRVVPMLPERISNELCSLRPREDRLAYSVLVTLDGDGRVKDYEIVESVIHSRHRLTYQQAQELIQSEIADPAHKDILWEIQTLRRLAKVLQKNRNRRGSLDFDLPAAKVDLDEDGCPQDIEKAIRLDSMRLVEEFMLLANETVAKHLEKADVPSLYRIHPPPAEKRVSRLREMAQALGYKVPPVNRTLKPTDLSALLEQARGRKDEELITRLVLRCMEQAHYHTVNQGHFGLASQSYTHFTSPIRRYPDLLVHRTLKALAAGERWSRKKDRTSRQLYLQDIAEHCSAQERVAAEAERETIALKKVEFMERHLEDEFEGVICGVKPFGLFVRVNRYMVEGLVPTHTMDDDFYQYLEEQHSLVGRNEGTRYRLGDSVKVKAVKVDKAKRNLDLELVE